MEDMTFSTRKGNAVYLEDVLNASIEKTLEIIKQKSPNLENKQEVARQVGVGALVFGVLYNGRIKDYTFSWENLSISTAKPVPMRNTPMHVHAP